MRHRADLVRAASVFFGPARRLAPLIGDLRLHQVHEADRPETVRRVFDEHAQRSELFFSDVCPGQHSGRELAAELARLRPGLEVASMAASTAELSSLHPDKGRELSREAPSAALVDVRFTARAG